MDHPPIHRRLSHGRPWPFVASATVFAVLAGCGGGHGGQAPPPVSNGSLSAQQVVEAQGAVEPAIVVVDAAASAPTATQIDSQRAALDGSTTSGEATIAANQAALDADANLTPAF